MGFLVGQILLISAFASLLTVALCFNVMEIPNKEIVIMYLGKFSLIIVPIFVGLLLCMWMSKKYEKLIEDLFNPFNLMLASGVGGLIGIFMFGLINFFW